MTKNKMKKMVQDELKVLNSMIENEIKNKELRHNLKNRMFCIGMLLELLIKKEVVSDV